MLCILGLIIYREQRIRKTSNLTQSLKPEDHWVEAMKTHESGLCATTQLLVCIPIILTIQGCAIPGVVFCCLHTCYKCLLSKIMTRRKRRCSSNNNEFLLHIDIIQCIAIIKLSAPLTIMRLTINLVEQQQNLTNTHIKFV